MAKPRVWVFGGGIAGLTAAHELAERGYQVTVIEAERDPRRFGEPALGGMARTSWATILEPPGDLQPASDMPRPMGRVSGLVQPLQVFFETGTAELTQKSKDDLEAFKKAIESRYGKWKPRLLVHGHRDPNSEADLPDLEADRARVVRNELATVALTTLTEEPLTTHPDATPLERRADVYFRAVPAEHGFRYFPSFYRHVFDTMQRIRLVDDHKTPTARPFQTVLDNLVPTKTVVLAVDGKRSVTVPREPIRSWRDAERLVQGLLQTLDYTAADLGQIALKLTKYMTSGRKRRATYEAMTYFDFLGGGELSEHCRAHLDGAAEVLGGMRATESDARTQGTTTVQLLLSQLTGARFVDATLNAPTTSAWFAPWRDYLRQEQKVEFRVGTLDGFQIGKGGGWIEPTLVDVDTGDGDPPSFRPGDRYVIAVPLQAMLPGSKAAGGRDLCRKFLEVLRALDPQKDGGDFARLDAWIRHVSDAAWNWNHPDVEADGPFRHLAGLQFYFQTDAHPTKGHTLYLDAPWRLSSISPASYWTRARVGAEGYRGIISVDIGEWYTAGQRGAPPAWRSTRDEIAEEVWAQMTASVAQGGDMRPSHYHLDEGIELDAAERPRLNKTPYLITRSEDWPYRPGVIDPDDPTRGYDTVGDQWVLAGTYLKTFTRLTTMESANESARHAVNGLLRAAKSTAPRCEIRDPESQELPDLESLKELDDALVDAGLPHALDILGAGAPFEALLLPFIT
ncbi:MAG: FAD-dependent oxidoreductase [Minicystis sp.]